jgi:hypothetical protein
VQKKHEARSRHSSAIDRHGTKLRALLDACRRRKPTTRAWRFHDGITSCCFP